MQGIKLSVDALLRRAIGDRRLIKLRYQGRDRILEPHDYGVQNGHLRLLAYQVGGSSSGKLPNWRWLDVDGIADLQILDRSFPGRSFHGDLKRRAARSPKNNVVVSDTSASG